MCAQKLGNFRVERAKNVTRPPIFRIFYPENARKCAMALYH